MVLDGYGLWWAGGGAYLFDGFLRWNGGGYEFYGLVLGLGLFLVVILVVGG